MTDTIPDTARHLAADLEQAGVVVEATPHPRGVYLWTTDRGYGFGNIRTQYDFTVADVFTMAILPSDHRHYREKAAIFLNLVIADDYPETQES